MTDLHNKEPWKLIRHFAKNYPRQSCLVVGALLLAAVAETIGLGAFLPVVSSLIDSGIAAESGTAQAAVLSFFEKVGLSPTLPTFLVTIVLMMSAKAAITYFSMRYAGFVAADMAREFQLRLIDALMSAQWPYFSSLSIGAISNAIASESQRAGHSYMLAARATSSFIQVLIYVCAAIFISWQLSLIAAVVGGILLFLMKDLLKVARSTGQALSDRMDTLLKQVSESLNGAKPLKAMGMEKMFYGRMVHETENVVVSRKRQYEIALLVQMIAEPVIVLCLAGGLYYVLSYTAVPIENVIILALLFYRLMGYVTIMQSHYQNMVANESAVWSLQRQIEQARNAADLNTGTGRAEFKKDISLENVSIQYGKKAIPVFDGFSDAIPANKITAVFGPSGVGKTTLVDAVLGLIPIQSGAIAIDGLDMKDINLHEWRSSIGYVPQDAFLFHDTIRNNINVSGDAYTDEQVWKALKDANAHDFVSSLPMQLDEVVGERGGKLSGGQRQRITIARALIRKPRLMILDEPTSALDKESEQAVFFLLSELKKSMAIVIISHNPRVLDIADHTIRLGQS